MNGFSDDEQTIMLTDADLAGAEEDEEFGIDTEPVIRLEPQLFVQITARDLGDGVVASASYMARIFDAAGRP